MFTGIVQGTGRVVSIEDKDNFRTHVVELPEALLPGLETGASVANNGCCLTVTAINGAQISFDLMKETLRLTNLGQLQVGDKVNLERAAKFGDEIGGHLMSGHIITTAEIVKVLTSENNRQVWFKPQDRTLMKYILHKGFIGIDGISLTVMEDWHNFGADYDKTLMAWFERFQAAWPEIASNYSERFKRMFTYYLNACAGAFRARDIQLWQVMFSRGIENGLRVTR